MGDQTNISWADRTHNHWIGCTKVSNGPLGACNSCYAENMMDTRFHRVAWGGPGQGAGTRTLTSEANRRKPLGWETQAKRDGTRPFVFCNSLADVFDNEVPIEWLRELFDLIRATPHLQWLVLTKRPQLICRRYGEAHLDPPDGGSGHDWPANAWAGCTVVTQPEADRDVPILLSAKARLRIPRAFVSMEPLLGPVDLGFGFGFAEPVTCGWEGPALDWVITGGETDQGGPNARPSHPDWFRSLRDQCAAAGVPFHFKQWGEWTPGENVERKSGVVRTATWWDDRWDFGEESLAATDGHVDDEPDLYRVGKHAAGRLLDGVAHDARPAPC